ncbi:MAG: hypothetical protein H7318_14840 [Oligoflexus sp.]|nr:hypothetical protein [Oligoflexus sp.]
MKKLTICLLLYLLNGAWYANTRVKQTVYGDSSDKSPLEERDNAYMFCESDEDAERARRAEIDWKRSNADEFCYYRHRNRDDSWRSGWARSRLTRGCLSQLKMFGNEVYRCYDRNKDPEIIAIKEKLERDKEQAYNLANELYAAKAAELLKGFNQTFGDIDREFEAAKQDVEAARVAQAATKQNYDTSRAAIDRVLDQHKELASTVQSFLNRFDAEFKALVQQIASNDTKAKDLSENIRDRRKKIVKSKMTSTELKDLKADWSNEDKDTLALNCSTKGLSDRVENLRDYIGFSRRSLSSLTTDLNKLPLNKEVYGLRSNALLVTDQIKSGIDERSFIFDTQYDHLESDPVCADSILLSSQINSLLAATNRIEDAKKTTGVIVDLQKAIEIIENEEKDREGESCVDMRSADFRSKLFDAISRGEVSTATDISNGIELSIGESQIICGVKSLSPEAQEKVRGIIQTLQSDVRNTLETRLEFNAASAMIAIKLNRLKYKILKADMKAGSKITDLVWRTKRDAFLEDLNAALGKDIPRPQFKTWVELLDYDRMLIHCERNLDSMMVGDGL